MREGQSLESHLRQLMPTLCFPHSTRAIREELVKGGVRVCFRRLESTLHVMVASGELRLEHGDPSPRRDLHDLMLFAAQARQDRPQSGEPTLGAQ